MAGAGKSRRSPLPAEPAPLSLFAAAGPAVADPAGSLASGGFVARERWRLGRRADSRPAGREDAPARRCASLRVQAKAGAVSVAGDGRSGPTTIAGNDKKAFRAGLLPAVPPDPAPRHRARENELMSELPDFPLPLACTFRVRASRIACSGSAAPSDLAPPVPARGTCRKRNWRPRRLSGPSAAVRQDSGNRPRLRARCPGRRDLRSSPPTVRHDLRWMRPVAGSRGVRLRKGASKCTPRSTREFRRKPVRETGVPAARSSGGRACRVTPRKVRALRRAGFHGPHASGAGCARPLQFGLRSLTFNPARKGEHHGRPADQR